MMDECVSCGRPRALHGVGVDHGFQSTSADKLGANQPMVFFAPKNPMLPCFSPALFGVAAERLEQDKKWGSQRDHAMVAWFFILMEEVGELAQAIMDAADRVPQGVSVLQDAADLGERAKASLEEVGVPVSRDLPEVVTAEEAKEAVQVAAVAVAMLECIQDRGGSK